MPRPARRDRAARTAATARSRPAKPQATHRRSNAIKIRTISNTGIEVSIIGMGGVVMMHREQDDVNREVAAAFDRGVRYFDVAPQYGNSQELTGPALAPYRDRVTLACKTLERTADKAQAELDDSLAKLKTDHFDIYQMHALSSMDDIETALGPGGAIETFLRAKEQGKARLIGISAHHEEEALRAIESGHFDTVLLPLNYTAWTDGGFGPRALQAARQRGMGILALKAMARGLIDKEAEKRYRKCWYEPEDRPEVAELLLRWTLSLPGVSATVAPGDPGLFRLALDFADRFEPLDDAGRAALAEQVAHATPVFSA